MTTTPDPPPRGEFRLCHWLGLVGLTFLLGLWIVWLQVSITRLGYAVNQAQEQQEELRAQQGRLEVQVEQGIIDLLLQVR